MFGDNEAYLEKHRTAARSRPIEAQKLGPEFFKKENTKPLFNLYEILTVHNLYNYHSLLCISKILKYHTPIALYSQISLSRRKQTLIIAPTQVNSFVFYASCLWNIFRTLPEGRDIRDFDVTISLLKNRITGLVLRRQKMGDEMEWHPLTNFTIIPLLDVSSLVSYGHTLPRHHTIVFSSRC